ncbi:SDR family oxidoreductase [Roseimaritima ulvae]|uniref:Glucose 1-dehydrogenase 4 n=1 Tax=Roseimaritima ulvae TaxID=980254 RepID=A0A5B9QPH9_9BACT|nr:SDR family NAD(P)-dependent oxidoreductase [Roseimaritima ulvae]QEG39829.1 Glucose 1-dehydrogenase 4 [Roseimaritima ulvae]
MNIDLTDRVVMVTGGSEGIGAAIAKCCAQCGAQVAILSRDEQEMQAVVDEIQADGGKALWVKADVTDDRQVQQAVSEVNERCGQLDALVANAGVNGTWTPIDELTPEEWRQTIDVNLTGTYLAIHHCVPLMKQRGGGSIVVMSSINGTRTFSNSGASAYAASKAGQFALTKMLALELAPAKIRVNVICPGAIESAIHDKTEREDLESIRTPVEFPEGQIPLTDGAMGDPQQVAHVAAFLLSDLASHVTGTPVWIDGGQSLLR